MSILITGATGFVGLAVSAALLEAGRRIILFGKHAPPEEMLSLLPQGQYRFALGDICEAEDIERGCGGEAIEAVIHLAAVTAGPARERSAPQTISSVNVGGAMTLITAVAPRRPRRVVHLSSAAVYGFVDPGPFGSYAAGRTCPRPAALYGITKLAGEQAALRLGEVLDLDVRVVRLGAVFGPWEYETGVRDAMSPHLQVLKAAERGETALLPRPMRNDWIYARDAAAGIIAVLEAPGIAPERVFDLGGGVVSDLLEWAEALKSRYPNVSCRVAGAGESATVTYNLPRDRAPLDNSEIERVTGFHPRYDLAAAAQDYVEWLGRCRAGNNDGREKA